MKSRSLWLLILSLIASCMLPSCVPVDPYYGSSVSTSYGVSTGTMYRSYPSYGGYGGSYYSPGYSSYGHSYTHRACGSCGYNPCRCSSHRQYASSHNHSSHNHSSSKPKDGHGRITLLRGSDGDHSNRPQGSHPKEWYQKRGYDLKEYKYKDEAGHTHNKKKR
jgi:hypothetical protein